MVCERAIPMFRAGPVRLDREVPFALRAMSHIAFECSWNAHHDRSGRGNYLAAVSRRIIQTDHATLFVFHFDATEGGFAGKK